MTPPRRGPGGRLVEPSKSRGKVGEASGSGDAAKDDGRVGVLDDDENYPVANRRPGGGTVKDGFVTLEGDAVNVARLPIPKLEGLPDGYYPVFFRVDAEGDPEDDENIEVPNNKWSTRYREAIDTLRVNFGTPYKDGPLMIMPEKNSPEVENKLTSLVLYTSSGSWVQLAFKREDLYLVAFRNQHGANHTIDFKPKKATGWGLVNFTSDYKDMENESGISTDKDMTLNKYLLEDMVKALSKARSSDKKSAAEPMLVCTIMFAESARFECLTSFFVENSKTDRQLPVEKLTYLKDWSKMSKFIMAAILHPDKIVSINRCIQEDLRGQKIDGRQILNVHELIPMLAILCRGDPKECAALLKRGDKLIRGDTSKLKV